MFPIIKFKEKKKKSISVQILNEAGILCFTNTPTEGVYILQT